MTPLPEFIPDRHQRWRLLIRIGCADAAAVRALARECRKRGIPLYPLPHPGAGAGELFLGAPPAVDCDRLLLELSALLAELALDCDIVETRQLPEVTGEESGFSAPGRQLLARFDLQCEAASVFGTGGHPSTQLLAGMLIACLQGVAPPTTVLDAGCGSGILSLIAARLGVGRILAVDVDAEAVAVARRNVERNRLDGVIEVRHLSFDGVVGNFPLVLANLPVGVLVRYGEALSRLTRIGGTLLLAGLMTGQRGEVLAGIPACLLQEERKDGCWLAISLTRGG